MTPQAEADRAAIEAALEAGLAAYNGVPDSHSQNVANVVRAAITAYQAALRTPSASGWASAIEAAAKVCEERASECGVWDDKDKHRHGVLHSAAAAIRALQPAAAPVDSATVERVAAEKALREIHKLAVHRGTFASVDTRMEHAEHALSRIATLSTPTGKYAIVKGE